MTWIDWFLRKWYFSKYVCICKEYKKYLKISNRVYQNISFVRSVLIPLQDGFWFNRTMQKKKRNERSVASRKVTPFLSTSPMHVTPLPCKLLGRAFVWFNADDHVIYIYIYIYVYVIYSYNVLVIKYMSSIVQFAFYFVVRLNHPCSTEYLPTKIVSM